MFFHAVFEGLILDLDAPSVNVSIIPVWELNDPQWDGQKM
jgi:hypothetical protein